MFLPPRVELFQLAVDHQPLNLGLGFPEDLVPTYILDVLKDVVMDPAVHSMHQYTRSSVS